MPVRNGERYLNDAFIQISSNLGIYDEIVVVNDGSTDRSLSILNDWACSDQRVRILNNPTPGLTNALNLGIREASNDWIARVDVDDKYSSDRLSSQSLAINSNVGLIFSDYDTISVEGLNLGTIPSAIYPSATALSMITSQRTAHPSAMFSRDAFREAGGYLEGDFPAEDLSLWLRMIRFCDATSVPKTLLHYQISPNSVSANSYAIAKKKTEELLRRYHISNAFRDDVLANFQHYAALYGEENLATERVLLMFRDLLTYSRIYEKENHKVGAKDFLTAGIITLSQEKLFKSAYRLKLGSINRGIARRNS